MAATISGVVFNDLNNNGTFDPGDPGISNVFLTLFNVTTNTCTETITDLNGVYSFSIASAGTYRVYETVDSALSCPPTTFTQPNGFFLSNGPRVLSRIVTAAQVNNGAIISGVNFSHSENTNALSCTSTMIQFVNTPTEWYDINIVTGEATFEGLLNPANNVNAIGYNVLDNFIYAYDQTSNRIVRVDENRNLTLLSPNPPGLPANGFNTGSFDLNGHLFLFVNNTNRFYTVDLNQASATFMKLVDPTNGFIEQTSNFGTALSTTLNVSDWAYFNGFLYGVESIGNTERVMRVNPTNGTVVALTTSGIVLNPTGRSWGAVAIDASGDLFAIYNGDGGVFRFTISGLTATAARISTTFTTSFNDATMCPLARVGAIADLSVVKSATPNPVQAGDQITFSFLINNAGPDLAEDVTLTDTIPSEVLTPEYSLNGGVTFFPWTGNLNLGSLAVLGSITVLIRGTVSINATGSFSNTALVGSAAEDPNPDNNTSTVIVDVIAQASADMAIVKTVEPNPVNPGAQIEFTLSVSNLGPDDAENVVIDDIISGDITGAEYSLDGGVTFFPWTGSLNLGTFPANTNQTIIIRGTVSPNASGIVSNTATVSSTTPDPNPDNNTSTVEIIVGPGADISVVKTSIPNPVKPGGVLNYVILVANAGPDSADNVILTDVTPDTLTSVEYSIDGGITFFPWTGSLNLGTLANNAVVEVIIRGTVALNAIGIIVNTATVDSTTPDPNPNNNTSTNVTEVCDARCQAISDIIESVALEQTALSHIINAEGEKLQAVIAKEGITTNELLATNKSVKATLKSITMLETLLLNKLSLFENCACGIAVVSVN